MRFQWFILAFFLTSWGCSANAVRLVTACVNHKCDQHIGEVSRASPIVTGYVLTSFSDAKGDSWVYVSVEFDPPCETGTEFEGTPTRERIRMGRSHVYTGTRDNVCNYMSLGEHSLTVTLWNDVAEEAKSKVLERKVVGFTLVEKLPLEDGRMAYEAFDYPAAIRHWRPLAEEGHAEAQFNLGIMSRVGKGVPQDDADAEKWFRRAAEQGHVHAQFNLGLLYYQGQGVPQDYAEAVKWYRKAARQGVAKAQYNLANMYRQGRGVSQDDAEAVKWYRKAAEQQHKLAQNHLGVMYARGQGVERDSAEAVRWYRMSAKQGNAWAQANLGGAYKTGKGVPQDFAKAVKWFRKAAEQGNGEAQHELGIMFKDGRGVPLEDVEAYMWLDLAAKKGDEEAAGDRDDLKTRMTREKIAEAQRLAHEWNEKHPIK